MEGLLQRARERWRDLCLRVRAKRWDWEQRDLAWARFLFWRWRNLQLLQEIAQRSGNASTSSAC